MWLKILSWGWVITELTKAQNARVESQAFIKWRTETAETVFMVFRACFYGVQSSVLGRPIL